MPDVGFRGHEDPTGRDRVAVGVELAVADRRRHIHGPVASAAHVGVAALLEILEGADLVRRGMVFEDPMKLVVESLRLEVTLLLGDPLVQAEMWRDAELRHERSPE